MALTFQLYARDPDGQRRVEYLHCPPNEVVDQARVLLDVTRAREIEVRMGGHYMFTFDREMSASMR